MAEQLLNFAQPTGTPALDPIREDPSGEITYSDPEPVVDMGAPQVDQFSVPGWIGPNLVTPLHKLERVGDLQKMYKRNLKSRMGFIENITKYDPGDIWFAGDFWEANRIMDVVRTHKKLEKGERPSDQELIDYNLYIQQEERLANAKMGGKVAEITKGMFKFWGEIAGITAAVTFVGDGIWGDVATIQTKLGGNAAKKAMSEAAAKRLTGRALKQHYFKFLRKGLREKAKKDTKRLIYKYAKDKVKGQVSKKAIDLFTRAAVESLYTGIKGAVLTAGNPGMPARSIAMQRLQQVMSGEDEDKSNALIMGIVDAWIENTTEMSGEHFGTIVKGLLSKLPSQKALKIANRIMGHGAFTLFDKQFSKNAKGGFTAHGYRLDRFANYMNRIGANGLAEEFMEERLGGFLRGMLGVQGDAGIVNAIDQAIPTWEDAATELIAFSIPGIGAHSIDFALSTKTLGGVGLPERFSNARLLDKELREITKKDVEKGKAKSTVASTIQKESGSRLARLVQREAEDLLKHNGSLSMMQRIQNALGGQRGSLQQLLLARQKADLVGHYLAGKRSALEKKGVTEEDARRAGREAVAIVVGRYKGLQVRGVMNDEQRRKYEQLEKDGLIERYRYSPKEGDWAWIAKTEAYSDPEVKKLLRAGRISDVVEAKKWQEVLDRGVELTSNDFPWNDQQIREDPKKRKHVLDMFASEGPAHDTALAFERALETYNRLKSIVRAYEADQNEPIKAGTIVTHRKSKKRYIVREVLGDGRAKVETDNGPVNKPVNLDNLEKRNDTGSVYWLERTVVIGTPGELSSMFEGYEVPEDAKPYKRGKTFDTTLFAMRVNAVNTEDGNLYVMAEARPGGIVEDVVERARKYANKVIGEDVLFETDAAKDVAAELIRVAQDRINEISTAEREETETDARNIRELKKFIKMLRSGRKARFEVTTKYFLHNQYGWRDLGWGFDGLVRGLLPIDSGVMSRFATETEAMVGPRLSAYLHPDYQMMQDAELALKRRERRDEGTLGPAPSIAPRPRIRPSKTATAKETPKRRKKAKPSPSKRKKERESGQFAKDMKEAIRGNEKLQEMFDRGSRAFEGLKNFINRDLDEEDMDFDVPSVEDLDIDEPHGMDDSGSDTDKATTSASAWDPSNELSSSSLDSVELLTDRDMGTIVSEDNKVKAWMNKSSGITGFLDDAMEVHGSGRWILYFVSHNIELNPDEQVAWNALRAAMAKHPERLDSLLQIYSNLTPMPYDWYEIDGNGEIQARQLSNGYRKEAKERGDLRKRGLRGMFMDVAGKYRPSFMMTSLALETIKKKQWKVRAVDGIKSKDTRRFTRVNELTPDQREKIYEHNFYEGLDDESKKEKTWWAPLGRFGEKRTMLLVERNIMSDRQANNWIDTTYAPWHKRQKNKKLLVKPETLKKGNQFQKNYAISLWIHGQEIFGRHDAFETIDDQNKRLSQVLTPGVAFRGKFKYIVYDDTAIINGKKYKLQDGAAFYTQSNLGHQVVEQLGPMVANPERNHIIKAFGIYRSGEREKGSARGNLIFWKPMFADIEQLTQYPMYRHILDAMKQAGRIGAKKGEKTVPVVAIARSALKVNGVEGHDRMEISTIFGPNGEFLPNKQRKFHVYEFDGESAAKGHQMVITSNPNYKTALRTKHPLKQLDSIRLHLPPEYLEAIIHLENRIVAARNRALSEDVLMKKLQGKTIDDDISLYGTMPQDVEMGATAEDLMRGFDGKQARRMMAYALSDAIRMIIPKRIASALPQGEVDARRVLFEPHENGENVKPQSMDLNFDGADYTFTDEDGNDKGFDSVDAAERHVRKAGVSRYPWMFEFDPNPRRLKSTHVVRTWQLVERDGKYYIPGTPVIASRIPASGDAFAKPGFASNPIGDQGASFASGSRADDDSKGQDYDEDPVHIQTLFRKFNKDTGKYEGYFWDNSTKGLANKLMMAWWQALTIYEQDRYREMTEGVELAEFDKFIRPKDEKDKRFQSYPWASPKGQRWAVELTTYSKKGLEIAASQANILRYMDHLRMPWNDIRIDFGNGLVLQRQRSDVPAMTRESALIRDRMFNNMMVQLFVDDIKQPRVFKLGLNEVTTPLFYAFAAGSYSVPQTETELFEYMGKVFNWLRDSKIVQDYVDLVRYAQRPEFEPQIEGRYGKMIKVGIRRWVLDRLEAMGYEQELENLQALLEMQDGMFKLGQVMNIKYKLPGELNEYYKVKEAYDELREGEVPGFDEMFRQLETSKHMFAQNAAWRALNRYAFGSHILNSQSFSDLLDIMQRMREAAEEAEEGSANKIFRNRWPNEVAEMADMARILSAIAGGRKQLTEEQLVERFYALKRSAGSTNRFLQILQTPFRDKDHDRTKILTVSRRHRQTEYLGDELHRIHESADVLPDDFKRDAMVFAAMEFGLHPGTWDGSYLRYFGPNFRYRILKAMSAETDRWFAGKVTEDELFEIAEWIMDKKDRKFFPSKAPDLFEKPSEAEAAKFVSVDQWFDRLDPDLLEFTQRHPDQFKLPADQEFFTFRAAHAMYDVFIERGGMLAELAEEDRKQYEDFGPLLEPEQDIAEEQLPEGVPAETVSAPAEAPQPTQHGIQFFTSSGSYAQRTRENAEEADLTIAIAKDFSTAGERSTKKAAGDKYLRLRYDRMVQDTAEVADKLVAYMNDNGVELINIAGNGIYTLDNYNLTQPEVDQAVLDFLNMVVNNPDLEVKPDIITGGQTGIDEAGAKAGAVLGLKTTVNAPKGWRFRDQSGKDKYSEAAFKARFAQQATVPEEAPTTAPEVIQPESDVLAPEDVDSIVDSAIPPEDGTSTSLTQAYDEFKDRIFYSLERQHRAIYGNEDYTGHDFDASESFTRGVLEDLLEGDLRNRTRALNVIRDMLGDAAAQDAERIVELSFEPEQLQLSLESDTTAALTLMEDMIGNNAPFMFAGTAGLQKTLLDTNRRMRREYALERLRAEAIEREMEMIAGIPVKYDDVSTEEKEIWRVYDPVTDRTEMVENYKEAKKLHDKWMKEREKITPEMRKLGRELNMAVVARLESVLDPEAEVIIEDVETVAEDVNMLIAELEAMQAELQGEVPASQLAITDRQLNMFFSMKEFGGIDRDESFRRYDRRTIIPLLIAGLKERRETKHDTLPMHRLILYDRSVEDIEDEWNSKHMKKLGKWKWNEDTQKYTPEPGTFLADAVRLHEESRTNENEFVLPIMDTITPEWIQRLPGYIRHLYRKKETLDERRLDYMKEAFRYREESASAHERKIRTYKTAAQVFGLVPLHREFTKLFSARAAEVWRVAANKQMLTQMILERDVTGAPLVIPIPKEVPDYVSDIEQDAAVARPFLMEAARNLAEFLNQEAARTGFKKRLIIDRTNEPSREFQGLINRLNPKLKGYVRVDSPFNSFDGFWVRDGDAARILKKITSRALETKFLKAVEEFNAWSKEMGLALSGFHPFSLLESFIAMHGLVDGSKHAIHPKQTWDMLEQLYAEVQLNPELLAEWISAGLVADMTHPDVDMTIVGNRLRSIIDKDWPIISKGAEGLSWYRDKVSTFLWGRMHPVIKLYAAQSMFNKVKQLQKTGEYDWMSDTELRQQIAEVVNPAFGGLEWERYLWATPRVKQALHLLFFAPDWTFSAADIAGITQLPGIKRFLNAPTSDLKKYWQTHQYWPAMALIVMGAIPNAVQLAIYLFAHATGQGEPEDRPFVFLNEVNKDSGPFGLPGLGSIDVTPLVRMLPGYRGGETEKRRVYIRFAKQATEVFDGWLTNLDNTLMNKTSAAVRTAFEQMTSSNTAGWDLDFANQGLGGVFRGERHGIWGGRLSYLGRKFVPMSVLSLLEGRPTTFFAPSSRGMSKYVAQENMAKILTAYGDEETWRTINAKAATLQKLQALFPELLDALDRNGYNAIEVFKAGKRQALGRAYSKFYRALNDENYKKLEEAARAIIRLHGTIDSMQKSMEKRYKTAGREFSPDMREMALDAFGS